MVTMPSMKQIGSASGMQVVYNNLSLKRHFILNNVTIMNLPNYDHHIILLISRKGCTNSTFEEKETRAGEEDLADLWSHFTISSLEKPERSTILSTISNIYYLHNLHNPSSALQLLGIPLSI